MSSGPYDSWLLNELHYIFPAVLYTPERFQSVGDLTRYISEQARERGNTFSRYQNQFRTTVAQPPAVPLASPMRRAAAPLRAAAAPSRPLPQPLAAPTRRTVTTRPPRASSSQEDDITVTLESPDSGARVQFQLDPHRTVGARAGGAAADAYPTALGATAIDSMLASMLGLTTPLSALDTLFTGLGVAPAGTAAALTPVVVRPSAEQLDRATLTFTHLSGQPTTSCAVCQEDIAEGAIVRRIRFCNHAFHRECIDPWFQRDVHCPVCRFDIRQHPVADDSASDNSE